MNTSDRYTCSRFVFCLDQHGHKIEINRMEVCEDFLKYTCLPPEKGVWIKIPGYHICYFDAYRFYNHMIVCSVNPLRGSQSRSQELTPPQACGGS